MPRRTSAAEPAGAVPLHFVLVTLDSHLASASDRAGARLARELPGLTLRLHAAADWAHDPASLERCLADIARADFLVVSMLFMEQHFQPVLEALRARRDRCDALVAGMCAAEVVQLTRLGAFRMDGTHGRALAFLKHLRGRRDTAASAGARQIALLRRLPQILRFIPGTAQDVRAYFLTLQYLLAGSEDNLVGLVRFLVSRYAAGPRAALRGRVRALSPVEYPEVGVYHPRLPNRVAERAERIPAPQPCRGTVGLLLMRAYVLSGDSAHYDGVIAALEARGLRVVPAFATGLDARPAIERFFLRNGKPAVDAVVSLTGFSLVGGPAYNDARAAEEMLARLDVPYLAAHALEFQTLEHWQSSDRGLMPVEATMMVAIPELDGAICPMVFGGRAATPGDRRARNMQPHAERARRLAARVARLIELRRTPRPERRLAIVLFNFPPNGGSVGTAAHLAVFESLHRVLATLKNEGYTVEPPATVQALRERILGGNAERYGTVANVYARISADQLVRRERFLREIEAQWGPAPGRQQSDGSAVFVLGERFGNVFVGIQPALGYEGDPMRLLFERSFAPTHAFAAFYRWLREDFAAHAVLHFGTHGALEFMPGKQVGLSDACWPERLIGDLPNFYLYAANNPSEGIIAKRRAGATLVSYLTPALTRAGLYRGLSDLKASIDRWRALAPEASAAERCALAELIQAQAAELGLAPPAAASGAEPDARIAALHSKLLEIEATLIPEGLHVLGEAPPPEAREELLRSVLHAGDGEPASAEARAVLAERLARNDELNALVRALDGRFVRPSPGGDVLRNPEVLPTGRNLHGFDPFRIPSAWALAQGARQAARLLARHAQAGHPFPETVAMVLWGSDNLKNEGASLAQALALLGARPRFDSYGRLAGASLVPLGELGRPRVDVVVTLSGIFRDLLPLQTRLLAEAAFLAASADEPEDLNFVRKHALAWIAAHGGDLETAALRVFSNAEGAYGSHVNLLVDSSRWEQADELAEVFARRKCYAYDRSGKPLRQPALLRGVLERVEIACQNLDCEEVGVTTLDHYFDTLGGLSRAVARARGKSAEVYIVDPTRGEARVRTLLEQVVLETHTRVLNPKWYEAMLRHGYEGVRHIEAHVTNTVGWSATTGQVPEWVYQKITQTYLLDPAMRERLAALNPAASAKVANRLLEAHRRRYWSAGDSMLAALREAAAELEDRLEGVATRMAA